MSPLHRRLGVTVIAAETSKKTLNDKLRIAYQLKG